VREIICHCKCSSILWHFRVIWCGRMLCKVSLTVSGNGVIRSIAYEFLFVFDCNYGHIWYPFWDIEISVKNRDFFVAVVSLNISLSHSRLLKLVPFENLGTFLFAFHSNYGSILYHFWQRYWSKIAIFSYPLHSTPPLGGSPSGYRHSVSYGKTRMAWLLSDEKKVWGYV